MEYQTLNNDAQDDDLDLNFNMEQQQKEDSAADGFNGYQTQEIKFNIEPSDLSKINE